MAIRLLLADDHPIFRAGLRSLLAAQPEADPDRIGITGISWGGYLTCIVAGLDGRLKLAVPLYARGKLGAGSRIHGPAVVTQLDSTTLLLHNQVAEVHRFGSLIVREEKS